MKRYLQKSTAPIAIFQFNDIEQIIGNSLPKSDCVRAEVWWANDYTHSQSTVWIDTGYETDYVTNTYEDEKITFVKH